MKIIEVMCTKYNNVQERATQVNCKEVAIVICIKKKNLY